MFLLFFFNCCINSDTWLHLVADENKLAALYFTQNNCSLIIVTKSQYQQVHSKQWPRLLVVEIFIVSGNFGYALFLFN